MRRSKSYYRQQKRDMIRILTRSQSYWQAESARWHQMVDKLSAILVGCSDEQVGGAREVLGDFREWANEADAYVRHETRELKKWRAKRI